MYAIRRYYEGNPQFLDTLAVRQPGQRCHTQSYYCKGNYCVITSYSIHYTKLYEQTANPAEIDDHFPEEAIEETIGLENCLMFYAALQATREYTSWKDMRANMRRAIVGMQDRGKERFDRQNSR